MPTVTIPAGTLHYRTAGPADSDRAARRVRPRLPRRQPAVGRRRRASRRPRRSARTSSTGRSAATARRWLPDADLQPGRRGPDDQRRARRARPRRRHARRQRHRRRDLPAAARRRPEPHRPARADQLRRVRELPAEGVRAAVPRRQAAGAHSRCSWRRCGCRVLRHSPLAYGLLLRRPRDADLTRHWITPAMTDRRIRDDIARFARAFDRTALVNAAPRLRDFAGPTRIVWGTADRCFTPATGRRLAAAFAHGELVEVPDVVDVRVHRRAGRRRRLDRRHVLGGHAGLIGRTRSSPEGHAPADRPGGGALASDPCSPRATCREASGWSSSSRRCRWRPTSGSASRRSTCSARRRDRARGWPRWPGCRTRTRSPSTTRRCWPGWAASPTRTSWRSGSVTKPTSAPRRTRSTRPGLPMMTFMVGHVGDGSPPVRRLTTIAAVPVRRVPGGRRARCSATARRPG